MGIQICAGYLLLFCMESNVLLDLDMSSYLTSVFSSIFVILWITAIKAWYLYYFWCCSNIIRNCVKPFQGMLLKKLLSLFLHWPNKCWYALRPNNQSIKNLHSKCICLSSSFSFDYLFTEYLTPPPHPTFHFSIFFSLAFKAKKWMILPQPVFPIWVSMDIQN